MEGFVQVAKCRIKSSNRGLELVSIDNYWFEIEEDDPDFVKEEVELWGVEDKFKARLYRPRRRIETEEGFVFDPNQWFIVLRDVEEAGELEYFV